MLLALPKLRCYSLASVSLAKAVRLLFTTAQNGARRLRLRPWELSRKKSLRTIVNCCYGDHKLVMCHTQAAVKHSFSTSHHRGMSASHTLTIKKQLF